MEKKLSRKLTIGGDFYNIPEEVKTKDVIFVLSILRELEPVNWEGKPITYNHTIDYSETVTFVGEKNESSQPEEESF